MSSVHDFDNDAMFGCDLRVCPPKPSPMSEHTAMTNEQHPITPPAPPCDLVKLWLSQWVGADTTLASYIATRAAQWGWVQRGAATKAELQQARDEELDACCEWVKDNLDAYWARTSLRAARRPKPPIKADQALEQLKCIDADLRKQGIINTDKIRRALERLKELEALPND